MRGHFRAGWASVDLTPDPATRRVELSGYVARPQPATAVRDPVGAAVLALQVEGAPPVLLVALDACSLDAAAAERIASSCTVPDERLILVCTHTHSAPALGSLIGCGAPDPAHLRHVALRVGDAVRRAVDALVPCRIGWGRARLPSAPWGNRRQAGGPTDPRLHLLKVERAESDRTPICGLWSAACHPVVLGPENAAVSADFVGVVGRGLPFPSMFVQGCCGDQNPLSRGEAALEAWAPVAEAAAGLWDRTPTAAAGSWATARAALELPRQVGDGVPAAAAGDGPVERAMAAWVRTVAAPGRAAAPTQVEVAALRAGDGRVAFWPGEPFCSLAEGLPDDVLVVGHCGASPGYVPDASAYAAGGYEVADAHRYYGFPSALAPEAGRRLRAATEELLAAL